MVRTTTYVIRGLFLLPINGFYIFDYFLKYLKKKELWFSRSYFYVLPYSNFYCFSLYLSQIFMYLFVTEWKTRTTFHPRSIHPHQTARRSTVGGCRTAAWLPQTSSSVTWETWRRVFRNGKWNVLNNVLHYLRILLHSSIKLKG